MDTWQIAVSVGGALVSIGSALNARREQPHHETVLPPAPAPAALPAGSAELEALRTRAGALEGRVEALEARERARDEAAAEFRGEIKARLARVFERLRIKWEERHERGSDG
jgi:hypothetical protein